MNVHLILVSDLFRELKCFFFLLAVLIDELISTAKVITSLSIPPEGWL